MLELHIISIIDRRREYACRDVKIGAAQWIKYIISWQRDFKDLGQDATDITSRFAIKFN